MKPLVRLVIAKYSLGSTRCLGCRNAEVAPPCLLPQIVSRPFSTGRSRCRLLAASLARFRDKNPRVPPRSDPLHPTSRFRRPACSAAISDQEPNRDVTSLLRWSDPHDEALELVQRGCAWTLAGQVLDRASSVESRRAGYQAELAGTAGYTAAGHEKRIWQLPHAHRGNWLSLRYGESAKSYSKKR